MLSEFFQGILNKITVEFGNLEGKSAQYNTETNVLTINSEGEFPMQTYIHELIHAWQDLQGYSERSTHSSIEFETYVVSNIWAFYENYGLGADDGFDHESREFWCFLEQCTHDGDLGKEFDWSYFYEHIGEFMEEFMNGNAGHSARDEYDPDYQYHWEEILRAMFPNGHF